MLISMFAASGPYLLLMQDRKVAAIRECFLRITTSKIEMRGGCEISLTKMDVSNLFRIGFKIAKRKTIAMLE